MQWWKRGILFSLVLLISRSVYAQACCSGAAVLNPGRLALHEDALVGMQTFVEKIYGSFGPEGEYRPLSEGTSDINGRGELFASVRWLEMGQVHLIVPMVWNYREAKNLSSFGGGLGDVRLSARYDFFLAGKNLYWPGIAVLVGVVIPTGIPADQAERPLLTDETGTGSWQGTGAIALEQVWGRSLVNWTTVVTQRIPRSVFGSKQMLGTQVWFIGSWAYLFKNETGIAFSFRYALEGDMAVNEASIPGTSRASMVASLSGTLPIMDTWRLQGGGYMVPPVSHWLWNGTAHAGVFLTLIRSWF
ncbi:hypothetical protein [Pajaroellobacter abortibovis]|uniref:Transporter n=1 Tax=Pajaroellobacter abortibovis TaxID=1882918 RepID=A0A1L6MYR3_9BACT|nr:hypothetical protein [Pajaroellobacter abortibovis]APS00721.1 hypothetical protein BCY86_08545 [Pajaroellobacter abortibovis]